MMKIAALILVVIIFGSLVLVRQERITVEKDMTTAAKTISVDGFQATWHFQNDHLVFEVSAPTEGWVALGFNPQDDIVNTNLIMGAVVNGNVVIEDQYVVKLGEHPQVAEIGGQSAIFAVSGSEQKGQTAVSFSIPQQAIDQFHYDLAPQQEIYLIVAYSQADDFNHHSIMRKHLKVTL